MKIGEKASAIISRTGISVVLLHNLHIRSDRGDRAAGDEIRRLIKIHPELRFVFYTFRSAADRVSDAKHTVRKLKGKKGASADPRNGSWEKLKSSVGKKPGLALSGGLPSLGKSAR